ncbi:PQQ-binding-like beta-propeller repeat protein [Streptomyces sp. MI02-7b]|uniref:outer membrane protein assembly factor BamB family protein n=1 Tax=Streptomyces sp. MI02-7b TaxID=462941 RepID=UPI0029A7924A|nr:PQQ-binding-like beta-propeller repeat protein [Streptomyces sp. MI02-7b]MDX3077998.1 PQQ-binding-like beta-propeller repeat protein [Streptomyces sp. MI02-7b]
MDEDRAPQTVWKPAKRLRALKPVWQAAHDGRADAGALASLLDSGSGLVLRAAFDRVRAFDAETGEQRWAWEVPGRDVLSAVADEATGGVVLLAHWPDTSEGPEKAGVTALDTASGKGLWSARLNLSGLSHHDPGLRVGTVALSGECALVTTGEKVVARDARTGRHMWSVPHEEDHGVRIAAAGGRLVVVTENSGITTVLTVALADGAVLWKKPLPVDGPVGAVGLLGADPLLLAVEGEGRRGPHRLLRLDEGGGTAVEIPMTGGHGTIRTAPWTVADGRRRFTAVGDTLLAFVEPSPEETLVRPAGFSLSTGRHLWTSDHWGIVALAPHRGHVVMVRHYDESFSSRAYVLDAATGREVARRSIRRTGSDEPYTLHVHGRRLLWVSTSSTAATAPVKAYDWR